MVRSGHLQCFKFRRIFRQMDVVRRRTSANRRKYSNPVIFSHKLTGIIKHCTFVHWFFPTNWWELSNTILSSPNFSHKLTGIIPQTDLIFPTNWHDFSHKAAWFFPHTYMNFSKKWCLSGHQTYDPPCQASPALSSRPPHLMLSKGNKALQF